MYRFPNISLVLLTVVCVPALAQDKDDPRRFLDPAKALTGHWVTASGHTDYYFADGKLIMVDEGETKKMTYEVLGEEKDEVVLRLKIVTESGGTHEKTLRYATTRRGLLETVSVKFEDRKLYVSTIWKYVDDKTEPAKKE